MNRHLSWLFLLATVFPAFAQTPAPLAVGNQIVVRTANERSTLDRRTGEIVSTVDVTLYNLGGREILAPLHAVISLSTGGVTVTGADGGPNDPPYNAYYRDLTSTLTGGRLAANETRSFSLTFRHARTIDFTYEIVPLAGSLRAEHAPQLNVPPGPFTVDEGQLLQIPFTATDPDGDVVTLGAAPAISNALFDSAGGVVATGRLEFIPDFEQAGFYTLQVKAVDRLGQTVTTNLLIEVRNVNRPPVMNGVEARTVAEGDLLKIDLPVSDPDGDLLIITPDVLPPNALLITGTPKLVFAPDFDQAGDYTVVLTVSDGSLSAAPQNIEITVEDVVVSDPGETNQFTLSVDPISSPTLATRQRVTGNVNGSTNAPAREPATAALITGLSPSLLRQGETSSVVLTGATVGLFATHFDATSVPDFGPDIIVNSVTVSNASLLVASVSVPLNAAPGVRDVFVQTSNETAYSVVALTIDAGTTSLTGKLVNADTTNAIAGALVSVQGTAFSTITGPDGTFSINGLPPGEYILIINPPNHELITLPFTSITGIPADLGEIKGTPTVFDPTAPASVSLLSVLGRGATEFDFDSLSEARQAIRDSLLLCGGTEAGVLDPFGTQLNPDLTGDGYISLQDEGVRMMAERTDRGENTSLADILLTFSFAFEWTNGDPPLDLQEWLDGMQVMVNRAWSDPRNPTNYLAIMMFNNGTTLSPLPPQLSSSTRLNPLQYYMFVMSMLSYMTDPQGTNLASVVSVPQEGLLARMPNLLDFLVPTAYAQGPVTEPSRRWTGFWRGFSQEKNRFMELQLSIAQQAFVSYSAVSMIGAAGGVRGALVVMPIQGLLAAELLAAFGNIAFASLVPEPPLMRYAEVYPGPHGKPRVRVKFRRSSSDQLDGRFIYSLYRFRGPDEGRDLANIAFSTNGAISELQITDNNPIYGASFYGVTVSRILSLSDTVSVSQLETVAPWWTASTFGLIEPISHLAQNRNFIMSDYSAPAMVNITAGSPFFQLNDIEIDELDKSVYYSDRNGGPDERNITRIRDLGEGDSSLFALTGFANPGQQGLAIDKDGGLYSGNAASDSQYGGRIFRYAQPDGARDFVGSINYYSRDLFFANPVSGGPMAMGPPSSPSVSSEDLYVVDMLAGQVKRAPVRATYDPFRRVAQPYANIPIAGRPVDLEVSKTGTVYLLVADAKTRGRLKDKEKGSMHIPPGAPVRQSCPEGELDSFADPVYPFSGEFYESVEDIRIKGIGLDFVWTRKYRSKIGINTVQGNNWDFSYNISITENTNTGGIIVRDGYTRSDEYVKSGTNNLWTLSEFFRELRKNGDGTYTLEFEDKGEWNFYGFTGSPDDGRIKESVDRFGNKLQFFYDGLGRLLRVNDTLGRDIYITYNGAGYIDHIADFAGRVWRYEYFSGEPGGNPGDLKAFVTPSVTNTPTGNNFPLGKRLSYTYSTGSTNAALNGNLLTTTDGRRNDPNDPTFGLGPYLRNIYASTQDQTSIYFDRLVRQEWGDPGDVIDFVYLDVNPTEANGGAVVRTIINDREGNVKEYFYNEQNQCTIRREYTGKAIRNQPTTDTQNRPVGKLRETDPDYFETKYEWTSDSLKRREVHPNGNITEWVYEADLDALASARTKANIREIRHLPGSHTPVGSQTSIVERFEYDTSYGRGCCGFNFVTKQSDGRGNETRKWYDALGNLTSVVHRVSSIREDFAYDSRGRMIQTIHPDNGSGHRKVDRMVYYGPGDGIQNGYLKQLIADDGFSNITIAYQYDIVGNATNIFDARGNNRRFVYNSLNQIVKNESAEVTAGSGLRYATYYYFDANNNINRIDRPNVDENGAVSSNPFFSELVEFEILNNATRVSREVAEGKYLVTERRYDRNRNAVLVRTGEAVIGNQPGNVVRTVYDERDLLFKVIRSEGYPEQVIDQVDYDGNGNPVREVAGQDNSPRTVTREFDAYNRKVSETDPMGNRTVISHNENNLPTNTVYWAELADGAGGASNIRMGESRLIYDAVDRMVRTETMHFVPSNQLVLTDGVVVGEMFYSDYASVVRSMDDNGHAVDSTYNTEGRLAMSMDAAGNTISYVYDENGNVLTVTETEFSDLGGPPQIFITSSTYDNLNRLIQVVDAAGNTNRFAYDARDNVVLRIDAKGNRTRTVFDGADRPIQSIMELTSTGNGSGSVIGAITNTTVLDDNGRVFSISDGLGQPTRFYYDNLDRTKVVVMADGTTNRAFYDIHNNVVSNIDANGSVRFKQYDLLNRLTRTDVIPGPGVSSATTFNRWVYDGASRVVEAEDDDSLIRRTFDSAGNMRSEELNGLVTTMRYDGSGRPVSVSYPGGRSVTNHFDALNRLREISDETGSLVTFDYAGVSRLARRTQRNNTQLDVTYDAVRRITRTTHRRDPLGSPVVLDDLAYAWDQVHNKTLHSNAVNGLSRKFSYDSVHQMVRSTNTAAGAVSYGLNVAGSRTNVAGVLDPGGYIASSINPEPADAQVQQYTATPFDVREYDRNGNLLFINRNQTNEQAFTYDINNMMVSYRDQGRNVSATYAYDVFGRRILRAVTNGAATTTRYFYNGGKRVVEERNAIGTVTATYIYGGNDDDVISMRRSGNDYFYHQDDLLNVTKLTDQAGTVVEQYVYGDFGQPQVFTGAGVPLPESAVGNPYLFSGRNYDLETGFSYLRSRYLDSRVGRFTTRDSIGVWGDPKNHGNGYTYAGNNPWTMRDPDGTYFFGQTGGSFGGFMTGVGQSGMNFITGIPQLGYAMATDFPGFLTGVEQMGRTILAGDRDGFIQMMYPEIYKGMLCWEFLTDFERGYVAGRIMGVIGEAATGAAGTLKGAKGLANRFRNARAGGGGPKLGSSDVPHDPMGSASVFDHKFNPALREFWTKAPTMENILDIFDRLGTPKALELAEAIRSGGVTAKLKSGLTHYGVYVGEGIAEIGIDRAKNAVLAAYTLAHEGGGHAIDDLVHGMQRGTKHFEYRGHWTPFEMGFHDPAITPAAFHTTVMKILNEDALYMSRPDGGLSKVAGKTGGLVKPWEQIMNVDGPK